MPLRDSIIRQRGTSGAGSYGSTVISWTSPATATYTAEVMNPTSAEDVADAQRVNAQYVVQAYGSADITAVDRIVWQGATYEVASGIEKLSAHGRVRQIRFMVRKVTGG